ncbi:hypothetical protein CLOM_g2124 [Closterium sp. NIES-68]|nr:hypothetical protein CLOM_g2124 [Closterium sp. NIES-68]GJP70830.1 hypothetical protein CLOP_g1725 [Closterium sp. NIES-67]
MSDQQSRMNLNVVFVATVILFVVANTLLAAGMPSNDFEKYAVRSGRLRTGGSANNNGGHRVKWRKLQVLVTCSSMNLTACGSVCVDTKNDLNNCGACGSFCDISTSCCDGKCTNLDSSLEHCGGCYQRCPGTCTLGVCDYGGASGYIPGVTPVP